MSDAVVLTVDGREIEGRPGESIMQAADRAGVYIPRLCWMKELTAVGSCRVCTVRANGRTVAACTQPILPGMVVDNDTEELLGLRRDLIDMLFVEGNHFCSVCEAAGACELQALAQRFGITAPRYPYQFPVRELDSTHPEIFIDRNRCVLCRRCVRASDELDGKHVFAFVGRGDTRRVAVASFRGLGSTDAAPNDRAVRSCPTGALVVKDEAYRTPIGQRKFEREPIGADVEGSRARR